MWVVIYRATYTGNTYHKVFKSRSDAKQYMHEYIEEDGDGCLLCRATEGFGKYLYDDNDLPLEMLSDKNFTKALEDMNSRYKEDTRCRQITTLSQNTHRSMESVKQ